MQPFFLAALTANQIAYDLKALFTAADQTFSNAQVLDTAAEGVDTGSLTVVDTSTGTVKIVGNELEIVGSGSIAETGVYSTASYAKELGKAFFTTVKLQGIDRTMSISLQDSAGIATANMDYTFYLRFDENIYIGRDATLNFSNVFPYTATDYQLLTIMGGFDSSGISFKIGDTEADFKYGIHQFIKGGTLTNWTRVWNFPSGNATPLYYAINTSTASTNTHDNLLIPTLPLDPDIMFQPMFLDTFTGTNDDQLVSNHTPEVVAGATGTGNPWQSGSTTWTIQSNAASNDPGLEASLWDADAAVFTSGTYSWVAWGSNTIANDVNSLKITYVDNENGAYVWLRNAADLSSDLTIGKIYSFSTDNKVGAGDSVSLRVYDGVSYFVPAVITSTSFVITSSYLTAKSATTCNFLSIMSAGEELWYDNLSLQEITLNELFATDDLSITEGLFDINLTIPATTNGMAGLVLALDSESSPANFIQVYYNRGTLKVEVWKCVAGAYTNLINTAATYAAGAQLRAIVDYVSATDDLKLKVYYNSVLIGTEQTITDNGIAGNTRHGVMSVDSANTLDNFTVHNRTNAAWDTLISESTGDIY